MLNEKLINQQELSEDEVHELELLHTTKDDMFEVMEKLNPKDEEDLKILKMFVILLESLEYNMQRVWKFEQNRAYHSWWFRAPHCKCPKMDNMEVLGSKFKYINSNCELHAISKKEAQ